MGLEEGQQLGVGVEHAVHVADVAGPEAGVEDLGVPAVAVVAGRQARVVGDVARRLLEVGHQAPPLEDLGEHVRGLLAGEVDAAELGDGVVAEVAEDPLVELLGPLQPDRRVDGRVAGDVEVVDELVEEEPPQALRRARVAGEERPADDLRQVDEREHRTVEVRDVVAEHLALVGGEGLGCVGRHLDETTRRRPAGRGSRRGPDPAVAAHPEGSPGVEAATIPR